ncbi:MAG: IS200/IS605 family transposase [Armatimonas sp.]
MALRRAAHSVYDCWYHLVWTPKKRRPILKDRVALRLKEIFEEIADNYDITIGELHIAEDHVHLYCGFPPRHSISYVVRTFKSLSARQLFSEFEWLRAKMLDSKIWEEGYFVRTVGDGIDGAMVKKYIASHREESHSFEL